MTGIDRLENRNAYLKATNGDGVVVLEGTTTWCPQCKAIAPFVEKLRKKYPDTIWYEYDVENNDDIAQELGARVMPSFNVFKDGEIMDGISGNKPNDLEKAIKDCYDGKVVEE